MLDALGTVIESEGFNSARRLLKNPHMSRCCQFSEDRKEPSAGRSRSATDKLGDIARAENWRNPKGVSVTCVSFNSLLAAVRDRHLYFRHFAHKRPESLAPCAHLRAADLFLPFSVFSGKPIQLPFLWSQALGCSPFCVK